MLRLQCREAAEMKALIQRGSAGGATGASVSQQCSVLLFVAPLPGYSPLAAAAISLSEQ